MIERKIITAGEAAKYCRGKLIGNSNAVITNIVIDSRNVKEGSLFVALKGENTDGNNYVNSALDNGAACVLCSTENTRENSIVVDDTLLALQKISEKYKSKIAPKTVAVTGSIGKTTTKEFIYAVLCAKFKTHKTQGNYNSIIGLPLTLLEMNNDDEAAVLEMGMSYKGEIKTMSDIAKPDIAVITNIGTSHLENLGSRENIMKAKLEITSSLSKNGALVLNGDDAMLWGEKEKSTPYKKIYIAINNEKADYIAKNIRFITEHIAFDILDTKTGEIIRNMIIPTIGKHNVYNSLSAYVCGGLFGMSVDEIRKGLMSFENTGMRQKIYTIGNITIIADCYNAAPESMYASLDVLMQLSNERNGKSHAVLGDMLELGENTNQLHFSVGEKAAHDGIDYLYTFGEISRNIAMGAQKEGMSCENIESETDLQKTCELAQKINARLSDGDTVLFKASRGTAIERVIEALEKIRK